MNETMKLCAAIVGGYALGRTKKGKKALSLAIWWASRKYGIQPRELIARGFTQLAESEAGKQLLDQVRGPLLAAGKRAALATVEGGVGSLTKNLGDRTSNLTEGASDGAKKTATRAKSATRSTTKSASGTTRKVAAATKPRTGRSTTSRAKSSSTTRSSGAGSRRTTRSKS